MIPWMYHRLTPRDQSTDLLRTVTRRERISATAVTLQRTYIVPEERLLLLNAMSVYVQGGGAQTPFTFTISIQEPPTFANPVFSLQEFPRDESGSPISSWGKLYNGSPLLMINPGHRLIISADFSAGVFLNELQFSFNGILIPHGTFST